MLYATNEDRMTQHTIVMNRILDRRIPVFEDSDETFEEMEMPRARVIVDCPTQPSLLQRAISHLFQHRPGKIIPV